MFESCLLEMVLPDFQKQIDATTILDKFKRPRYL